MVFGSVNTQHASACVCFVVCHWMNQKSSSGSQILTRWQSSLSLLISTSSVFCVYSTSVCVSARTKRSVVSPLALSSLTLIITISHKLDIYWLCVRVSSVFRRLPIKTFAKLKKGWLCDSYTWKSALQCINWSTVVLTLDWVECNCQQVVVEVELGCVAGRREH